MREYHFQLDKEGHLWHDGTQVTDPTLLRIYLKGLVEEGSGVFTFRCAGEANRLHPEDTPYVVRDVDLVDAADGSLASVRLLFAAGYSETLDPASLRVGAENVLYARVRDGRFRARFTRTAYYRLAERVERRGGEFVLTVGARDYPIGR